MNKIIYSGKKWLFDIKDFIALANAKADLYIESNNQNVIEYLVNSNRYNYLKEAIKLIDINKFNKTKTVHNYFGFILLFSNFNLSISNFILPPFCFCFKSGE